MKNKKLHDIMKHSNNVTKMMVSDYNLTNPKVIAKINQITDLILSVKDDLNMLKLINKAITNTYDYMALMNLKKTINNSEETIHK